MLSVTDVVAMVMQEAELNELRATIELLRQQGHAHSTPLRRPPPFSVAHSSDLPDGQSTQSFTASATDLCF